MCFTNFEILIELSHKFMKHLCFIKLPWLRTTDINLRTQSHIGILIFVTGG